MNMRLLWNRKVACNEFDDSRFLITSYFSIVFMKKFGSILALKILDEVYKNAKCDEYEE